uniref:RING-type domain-containing protein n=1 Tax=Steinernema glaseri TaxID=37863 RepID=A0A1I8A914_9BILA
EEDYRDKEPMVPSEGSVNDQKTRSTKKTRKNVYPTTGTLTRRTKKDSKVYGTGFNYEKAFRDCAKVCSTKSPCKSPAPRSYTDSQLEDLKKKAPRPSNSVLKNGRCDGPCKKMRPIQELHLIGLCEHAICGQCMEDAPYIDNNAGGSGCPNQKCYETDVAATCTDPERRHRKFQRLLGISQKKPQRTSQADSTSFSTPRSSRSTDNCECSNQSSRSSSACTCARLILMKAYLYDASMKKKRLLHSVELPSYHTLEKACAYVFKEAGAEFSLRKAKKCAFIAKNGSSSARDWLRVERNFWEKPIDFFAKKESLNIVFDITK